MSAAVMEMQELVVAAASAPWTPLLNSVTWSVEAGEFWVVAGWPGSGKSSLLLTAAGLLRPLGGTQRMFGCDTGARNHDDAVPERLRVGLVFADEGRLFNQLTVAENVALPLCYHRDCHESEVADRVSAILEATELADLAHCTPGSIHRRLHPRVALARALALTPELLLLDNPLRGLDWRQARWWLEFLDRLHTGHSVLDGRPTTLVVATDDLRPWMNHGQKFALLHENRWMHLGDRSGLKIDGPSPLREWLAGSAGKD